MPGPCCSCSASLHIIVLKACFQLTQGAEGRILSIHRLEDDCFHGTRVPCDNGLGDPLATGLSCQIDDFSFTLCFVRPCSAITCSKVQVGTGEGSVGNLLALLHNSVSDTELWHVQQSLYNCEMYWYYCKSFSLSLKKMGKIFRMKNWDEMSGKIRLLHQWTPAHVDEHSKSSPKSGFSFT